MLEFRSAGLLTALFFMSACAVNDQNTTRAQGAGTGAALGAGLGLILGGDAEDALIGAAVGGLAGLAAGEAVARRKTDYATAEDMIVQERRIVTEKADQIRSYNAGLEQQLDTLNRDIVMLETAISEGRADHSAKLQLRRQAARDLDQAQRRLAEVNQEIDVSRKVYRDARRGSEPVDLVEWDRRIRELERRRDTLATLIGDFETSARRVG